MTLFARYFRLATRKIIGTLRAHAGKQGAVVQSKRMCTQIVRTSASMSTICILHEWRRKILLQPLDFVRFSAWVRAFNGRGLVVVWRRHLPLPRNCDFLACVTVHSSRARRKATSGAWIVGNPSSDIGRMPAAGTLDGRQGRAFARVSAACIY